MRVFVLLKIRPRCTRYHHLTDGIFWVIIVISGLCAAGYMTVLFWERYLSKPTRTTIFTAYAPTTAIPFPAVTICNVNIATRTKIEQFLKTLELNDTEKNIIRKGFPQLLAFSYTHYDNYNMSELNILHTILEKNDYYNVAEVLDKINQGCDEMFVKCAWNKKYISCLDNFKRVITNNGFCCSFNYNTKATLHNPYSGHDTGLMVLLKPLIQIDEYSSSYSGFKVTIHYSTEYPGHQAVSKIVSAGKISYLQVIGTKTFCSDDVKNLPISQRHCLYPDEFRLKYFKNKYSTSNCLMECDAEMYFEKCGCVPFYLSFSEKPTCNISKIPCVQDAKLSKLTFWKKSPCVCQSQCEDIFYNVMSTSSDKLLNGSMSTQNFGNDTLEDSVLLNVHFLSNTHTILQTDTITSTIYLLSSFGGVYSLFMGCSLITIVEIIYYCLFRFVINMKLFGKVDTDVEYNGKNKIRKNDKRIALEYFSTTQPQQFNYNNVLLP